MKNNIRILITEEEVEEKVQKAAARISADYQGRTVHMVGVLKGSVFFACELAKRITVPVTMDFMSVTSYGDDTKSSGVVRIVKDLDEPLEGKDVLLVEDILVLRFRMSSWLDMDWIMRRNTGTCPLSGL